VFPLAQSLSQQGTAHRVKYISEKIPEKRKYISKEEKNKNIKVVFICRKKCLCLFSGKAAVVRILQKKFCYPVQEPRGVLNL
jgi:hypothetical protein